MIAHVLDRPLAYIGFGGAGHQVRDVLHVADLADLVDLQLRQRESLAGDVFNAGGGTFASASLREFTRLCESLSGRRLAIGASPETRPGDIPVYISDNGKVEARFGWKPARSIEDVARDLYRWITTHETALRGVLT
jgi:CDP-paratose 2-epimerase